MIGCLGIWEVGEKIKVEGGGGCVLGGGGKKGAYCRCKNVLHVALKLRITSKVFIMTTFYK